MTTSTSTCNSVFAKPMLDDKRNLKKYAEQLETLAKQGLLPDLKKKMLYKVYSLQGTQCGSHKSVILSTDDKHFVTVELGFTSVKGEKRIRPVTKKINSSLRNKLIFHGTIRTTGDTLISQVITTMKNFGYYFKYDHNCRNFCNNYLKSIGLGDTKSQTLVAGDRQRTGDASKAVAADANVVG